MAENKTELRRSLAEAQGQAAEVIAGVEETVLER